jgi:hypothetical protein
MDSRSTMATFNIDADLWDCFCRKAKNDGTNASTLLRDFIRDYLSNDVKAVNISKGILSRRDIDLQGINELLRCGAKDVLYFIQVSENAVKIGSAGSLKHFYQRFSECNRWVSNPIVIGFAFCDRQAEIYIHAFLRNQKVKTFGRELFELNSDVVNYISKWSDWNIYDNSESFDFYLSCIEGDLPNG